jgi:membrane-associated phospholipid phosphatase
MAHYPWKNKILIFSMFMLGYTLFYIYPNIRPPFQPFYLPLLSIDQSIPLIPWTCLIYLSDYLLFLVVVVMVTDAETYRRLSRRCFFTLALCGTFFLFFPTRYPRPEYPVVSNTLVAFVMSVISNADTPTNCFPSMHVALTGVATWSLRNRSPRVFGSFVLWSLAIFVSTLTTKQHYFLDVMGGIGVIFTVALLDWALFENAQVRAWLLRRQLEQKGSFKPRS